jgi:hypothetical protein
LKHQTIRFVLLALLAIPRPASSHQNRDTTDVAQSDKDIVGLIKPLLHLKNKNSIPEKGIVYFSVMPSTNSTLGGSQVIVSSINAAFYLGAPKSTYISSVYFVPYTNLGQQYGFMSTQNLWTNHNVWNLPGEFKIQKLNPYSYGLGSHTTRADQFTLNYEYIRLYFTANYNIRKHLYAGMGFNLDRYYNVTTRPGLSASTPFDTYGIGTASSSTSMGVNFNLLFDNRRNSTNPDKGFYSTVIYRVNPGFLANADPWSSLYLDTRKYFRLPTEKRAILATWFFYWASFGTVPYLSLPGTGMEYHGRSGRGYALGRFRGRQMLYMESEYRFTLSDNGLFGGVMFANVQSYEDPTTHRFQGIIPGVGFGARIKFNKESNTNLDLDVGFGKGSFNVYINLGELF